MSKYVLCLVLIIGVNGALSAPAWYTGKINRIWPHDNSGGFIITFSSPSSLGDCKHNYAYFKSTDLDPKQLSVSFSLALSAFHSKSKVGVVIDKSLNDEYCHALSLDIRD